MPRLSLMEAVKIVNLVKEQFGVELKTHSPCGTKGFFLTTEEPDPAITAFVREQFEKLNAPVEVSEDGKLFAYKW